MKPTAILNKSSLILLFGILMSAVVLGATVYQLAIPCTVTTKASYLLQLRQSTTPVTSISFGELGVGQISYRPSSTEYYKIKNIGDSTVDVTWSCVVPGGFILTAYKGTEVDPQWIQGETVTLAPNAEQTISFKLVDESAAPDTAYNFDINFEVVE